MLGREANPVETQMGKQNTLWTAVLQTAGRLLERAGDAFAMPLETCLEPQTLGHRCSERNRQRAHHLFRLKGTVELAVIKICHDYVTETLRKPCQDLEGRTHMRWS